MYVLHWSYADGLLREWGDKDLDMVLYKMRKWKLLTNPNVLCVSIMKDGTVRRQYKDEHHEESRTYKESKNGTV